MAQEVGEFTVQARGPEFKPTPRAHTTKKPGVAITQCLKVGAEGSWESGGQNNPVLREKGGK